MSNAPSSNARQEYRERFRCIVFRDVQMGYIAMIAGPVCALIMSKELGLKVREALREHPAPIFNVGQTLWAFIIDGPAPADNTAALSNELFKHSTTPLLPGARIALPTPGNHRRSWLIPPDSDARPTFAAAVRAVTQAARVLERK